MSWVYRCIDETQFLLLDNEYDGFSIDRDEIRPFGKFTNSPDLIMAAFPAIYKCLEEEHWIWTDRVFSSLMKRTIRAKEPKKITRKYRAKVERKLLSEMGIRSEVFPKFQDSGDQKMVFEGKYINKETGFVAKIQRMMDTYGVYEVKTTVTGDPGLVLKVMKAYDQGAKVFSFDMNFQGIALHQKDLQKAMSEEDKTYWTSADRLMRFSEAV